MKTVLLSLLLALRCYAPTPLFLLQNGATAAAFSPADVSGLTIWLVADDISGADGDTVQTWSARTPTTINATQATLASRPTLQTGEVNGHNAVLADGVNDLMTLSASVSSTASWTVFSVQKRSASGSLGYALATSSITPPYSPIEYGSLSRLYVASRTDQKYATIPSHAWHVLTGQDASGTLNAWVDGTAQTLTAASATGTTDFDRLFARSNFEFSAVYVAELIFYNRTLTTTERQNVEAYLRSAEKYGTPAP
jgi:hypothetical protein